jgi:hypothetical protein
MKKLFAQRTDWSLQPNALSSAYERLQQQHAPIIDLTVSNPTACGIAHPKDFLAALTLPEAQHYKPHPCGIEPARQAISDYYNARGFHVSTEQIILTASTSEAYNHLFRLLADYGDHVLFPQPGYPLFSYLGDFNDIIVDRYRLQPNDRFRIDGAHLVEQMNDHTKALVVVNPNNPTGSYIGREEKKRLNEICAPHQTPIISDEVFWDYVLDEDTDRVSMADNDKVLTFTLGGLSKMLGLPQMKLSWIVISGPLDQCRQARERLEVLADTYLSVNTPVQLALASWIARLDEFQKPIQQRINENLAALGKQLEGCLNCRLLPPGGGWYAVIAFDGTRSEEAWALKLLNNYHVFVHPGYFFDFEDQQCVVVSLLGEPAVFAEGVGRLLSRIEQETS